MKKLNSNLAYLGITCLIGLVGCSAINKNNESELERNSWIRCGQVLERYNRAVIERIYPTKDASESHNLILNQLINGNLDTEKRLEILESIDLDIDDYRNKKVLPKHKESMRV